MRPELRAYVVLVPFLKHYLVPPFSTLICRTKSELIQLRKYRKDLRLSHAPLGGGSYKISGNRLPKELKMKTSFFNTYFYSKDFKSAAVEQDEIPDEFGHLVREPVGLIDEILGEQKKQYIAQFADLNRRTIFVCPTNSNDYENPSFLWEQLDTLFGNKADRIIFSVHPMDKHVQLKQNFFYSIDSTLSMLVCELFVTDVTSLFLSAQNCGIKCHLLNYAPKPHREVHPYFRQMFKVQKSESIIEDKSSL